MTFSKYQEGIHIFWPFVCLKMPVIEKTENDIKNPVHSPLFLARFSRNDLMSTESDNIPSLQSLFRSKLTWVPQTSAVFDKSSDAIQNNISCVWIPTTTWFHYRVAEWIDSHSTAHIELSGFTGMTLKKGTILNFINFTNSTQIYHRCYACSENDVMY